jgi:hypothetical protein
MDIIMPCWKWMREEIDSLAELILGRLEEWDLISRVDVGCQAKRFVADSLLEDEEHSMDWKELADVRMYPKT